MTPRSRPRVRRRARPHGLRRDPTLGPTTPMRACKRHICSTRSRATPRFGRRRCRRTRARRRMRSCSTGPGKPRRMAGDPGIPRTRKTAPHGPLRAARPLCPRHATGRVARRTRTSSTAPGQPMVRGRPRRQGTMRSPEQAGRLAARPSSAGRTTQAAQLSSGRWRRRRSRLARRRRRSRRTARLPRARGSAARPAQARRTRPPSTLMRLAPPTGPTGVGLRGRASYVLLFTMPMRSRLHTPHAVLQPQTLL